MWLYHMPLIHPLSHDPFARACGGPGAFAAAIYLFKPQVIRKLSHLLFIPLRKLSTSYSSLYPVR